MTIDEILLKYSDKELAKSQFYENSFFNQIVKALSTGANPYDLLLKASILNSEMFDKMKNAIEKQSVSYIAHKDQIDKITTNPQTLSCGDSKF